MSSFCVSDFQEFFVKIFRGHAMSIIADRESFLFSVQFDPYILCVSIPSIRDGFANDRDKISVELASEVIENRHRD